MYVLVYVYKYLAIAIVRRRGPHGDPGAEASSAPGMQCVTHARPLARSRHSSVLITRGYGMSLGAA